MSDKIQKRESHDLAGTFRSANELNERMRRAMKTCHLVAPATSIPVLQEGCSVALSVVSVDIANETYDVGGGKRGLSKTVLEKIGSSLGVSWDPILSGRLDDGSDPSYVNFRAVGYYQNFDGQQQTIVGTKEMDLRKGSPQVEALEERARAKNKTAAAQIREMRLHIVAHAESKARLRALRSIGIRAAYTAEELQRPFVAAKVVFTGETDSPELRRMFAERIADKYLGARASLYGGQPAGSPASLALPPGRVAPPPLGSVHDVDPDSGEYGLDGYGDDRGGVPPQQRAGSEPQESDEPKRPAARSQRTPQARSQSSGYKMPFGRSKDVAIEDAPTQDLEWMANTIGEKLDSGESRYPEKDEEFHKALINEIARREAGAQQDGDPGKL